MVTSPSQPLVSVVMIFLNAETFIDEAIQSVLDQTYPAVELLLCDDGSTDTSTARAQEWARDRPDQVRYLEHPGHVNRGMSAARNLGIRAAQGELVAFLDADDVWQPDHLAQHVGVLTASPKASVVAGRALSWRSWDGSAAVDVWSPLPWSTGTVVKPPDMLTAVLRQGSFSTPMCSLLVRRDVLIEVGGGEEQFTGMFEDQALLAKLYLSQLVVLCDAPTAFYRQHPGSSTVAAVRRGLYRGSAPNLSRAAYIKWLRERPELRGPNVDPELASAFRAALRRESRLRSWRRRVLVVVRNALPTPLIRLLRRVPGLPRP